MALHIQFQLHFLYGIYTGAVFICTVWYKKHYFTFNSHMNQLFRPSCYCDY